MEQSCAKHILVVDDDITCLDIVSFVFQQSGYVVVRCASGESAIEYVRTILPDLILLDLLMPGLDGISTVKAIRDMGVDKMPIIAFTAVEDEDFHQTAIDAGCQMVLEKPCPPQMLISAINNALEGRYGEDSSLQK